LRAPCCFAKRGSEARLVLARRNGSTGGFERGARVSGLDASEALIAIARDRVPNGDFRIGELERLPFSDSSFDLATGFNSFQYAANPVAALTEARRVAKHGSKVVVVTWAIQRAWKPRLWWGLSGPCFERPA
jgi:ubiquinone/menaquinone biosynthesis C-methylase UbiE